MLCAILSSSPLQEFPRRVSRQYHKGAAARSVTFRFEPTSNGMARGAAGSFVRFKIILSGLGTYSWACAALGDVAGENYSTTSPFEAREANRRSGSSCSGLGCCGWRGSRWPSPRTPPPRPSRRSRPQGGRSRRLQMETLRVSLPGRRRRHGLRRRSGSLQTRRKDLHVRIQAKPVAIRANGIQFLAKIKTMN